MPAFKLRNELARNKPISASFAISRRASSGNVRVGSHCTVSAVIAVPCNTSKPMLSISRLAVINTRLSAGKSSNVANALCALATTNT